MGTTRSHYKLLMTERVKDTLSSKNTKTIKWVESYFDLSMIAKRHLMQVKDMALDCPRTKFRASNCDKQTK